MQTQSQPTLEELRECMRQPQEDKALHWRDVDTFMREQLVLRFSDSTESRWRGKWGFVFNEKGENIPPHDGRYEPGDWIWYVAVSGRAALVTCDTCFLGPHVRDGVEDPLGAFHFDSSPRPLALEWTRRIAREFDLRYVEAQMLRDWNVSYEEVDPGFDLEVNTHREPTAFEVLFYEV